LSNKLEILRGEADDRHVAITDEDVNANRIDAGAERPRRLCIQHSRESKRQRDDPHLLTSARSSFKNI